ncbi:MAG TPA: hypothetical protein VK509_25505 [Polyangiales bacterium]|nr:hypothetical protein [Polyangiales bacterium]
MRYLESTPLTLAQQNTRLWTAYEAEQRAARRLRADQSLDVRDGVPLPLAQAVTNGTNGYALTIVAADSTIAALPLDDWALAQEGRGGIDLSAQKDEAALDSRILDRLRSTREGSATAPPLGLPGRGK